MKWKRRQDPRINDELRYHRDRLIDDYVAAGMDRASAERRAFLEFGNVAGLEEAVRDVRGRWLADLGADLRYALRMLRRSPVFAAVAVLSLALGIGANAAIFSVINGVMLRALPVSDPDRLVVVSRLNGAGRPLFLSYPLFEVMRDHLTSAAGVFAAGTAEQTAVIDGQDDLVSLDLVSGAYFEVLGIQPSAGRLLSATDDVAAPEAPAAVMSDDFWQRRFGRADDAIGKTVTIRDRTFTIVGVTPAAFHGIRPERAPELTLPIQTMLTDQQRQSLNLNNYAVMARLKPGATLAQANAEVQTLHGGFIQLQASTEREKDRPMVLRQRAVAFAAPDGFNALSYDYHRSLLILMGSVGLVLLLACVNLSGLLLSRAAARQREIAIRLAMGAGRGRLLRQFLTESLLIALLGGGIGMLMAGPLAARLLALFLNGRNVPIAVAPDWRVAAFTAAASLVACVLAGLAPALHAVRAGIHPSLKEVRARGGHALGRALVVAQLTISMILVVGATLFIASLVKLQAVERGFDARGMLVVNVRSAQPYPAARAQAVSDALFARLRALPGVASASAAATVPIGGGLWERNVQVEGHQFADNEPDAAGFNAVAPDYFTTLGTPLLSGRAFDAHDTIASPKVAVVNDSFARYFFPDGSVLGRHVTSAGVTYAIVGVVGDAKYQNLRENVIKTLYVASLQRDGDAQQPAGVNYFVRVASGDPARLVPELARTVREADPALRVRQARPYTDIIGESIGTERTMATLGGVFGGLALLVAALGLFGLLAFQVARRTNEMGVRMALGAGRASLMRLVLRDVVVLVACGVVLGSAGAAMTTGLARTLLFGLTPTEPLAFAIAAAALASTALVAAWLPARRAASIDPLVALRHE
jgi:predicted permease